MVTAALLWSLGWFEPANPELRAYLSKPEPAFKWTRNGTKFGHSALRLTSQTWQGLDWSHDLVIVENRHEATPADAMVIEVTGWEPNQTDLNDAFVVADAAKMPVAVLFQIPNQPLWGHEEDDLIAHTFEKFIETGDPNWVLLFPMVKSVKSAMDAIEQATGIKKFVITGASKRGWTSWLMATIGDKRVVGVAPRVFDNLDFPKQLAEQKAYWGGFSPMIGDYTERGLQDLLGSDVGKKLIHLVDPLAAIREVDVPVLSITGTNDPYWTVDSTQVYWNAVPGPKWSLAVPNSGHVLTEKDWWLKSLGWFARWCAQDNKSQSSTSEFDVTGGGWELRLSYDPPPKTYRVWQASSDDLHFEEAVWHSGELKPVASKDSKIWIKGARDGKNRAVMVELDFGGGQRLTTPVHLVRKK